MNTNRFIPLIVPVPLLGKASQDPQVGEMADAVACADREGGLSLDEWVQGRDGPAIGRIAIVVRSNVWSLTRGP